MFDKDKGREYEDDISYFILIHDFRLDEGNMIDKNSPHLSDREMVKGINHLIVSTYDDNFPALFLHHTQHQQRAKWKDLHP